MSAVPPYITLRWRRPAGLFAPLGVLAAAGLPGGALAAGSPAILPLAGGVSLVLAAILAVSLLLCGGRDRTMPVMIATTLSVTHALLFVGGVAALALPAAGERLAALAGTLGAAQIAHSPPSAVLAAYIAAFFGLTVLASLALVALRYLAMTGRSA